MLKNVLLNGRLKPTHSGKTKIVALTLKYESN